MFGVQYAPTSITMYLEGLYQSSQYTRKYVSEYFSNFVAKIDKVATQQFANFTNRLPQIHDFIPLAERNNIKGVAAICIVCIIALITISMMNNKDVNSPTVTS